MSPKKARVVEIHSAGVISDGRINRAHAAKMIEAGLDILSPTGSAWDIVDEVFPGGIGLGIKVNSLAGRMMSTSPEVAYAVADVLHKFGHKKRKVIIWDRREAELKRAGFKISTSGDDFQCFATDSAGVGFARELYQHGSIGSMISRIQAEMADAMINVAVLKDHSLAGLSGCLKNYFGVIHNPNKYHQDMCSPFLADLYSLDVVRGRQKLAVFDALRVQINGGPGYVARWVIEYGSILLSSDAVALDTVGTRIIDNLRTKAGMSVLRDSGREPIGIKVAGEYGLGCAVLDDIEWITQTV